MRNRPASPAAINAVDNGGRRLTALVLVTSVELPPTDGAGPRPRGRVDHRTSGRALRRVNQQASLTGQNGEPTRCLVQRQCYLSASEISRRRTLCGTSSSG